MTRKIKRCKICGSYTLSQTSCPTCGGNLISPHPANFSLQDRYIDLLARLRRGTR
ncbi:MAG: nucleolar RNA-binding Nop10p family protein [Nitrososphaeria archaeon]